MRTRRGDYSSYSFPRSLLLPLLLAFAASLVFAVAANCQDWSGIDTRIKPALVRVQSGDLFDQDLCTGVVIDRERDIVLTAAHCIDENASIVVDGRDASVVRDESDRPKLNRILDLAILRVPGLDANRQIEPYSGTVSVGMPVAVAGYGLANTTPLYTFGWLSGPLDGSILIPLNGRYSVDSTLIPGQSGGAVVDSQGRLVSIVQIKVFVGIGPTPKQVVDFARGFWPRPKQP